MKCLNGLTDIQKKKILKTKLPINITFGDLNSELFFKWWYLTYKCNKLYFSKLENKKLTIKDGLFFLDNNKNGLKPYNVFNNSNNIEYESFSLTKLDCSWDILSGKDILQGYDSTKSNVKSCMTFNGKNPNTSKGIINELNFYCKNKNVSLLVIKEKEKIVARTLLWKNGKKKFFDNIYSHNPLWRFYIEMISEINNFMDCEDNYFSISLNYIPTFQIVYNQKNYHIVDYSNIPYLDNLIYYDKKTKKLTNNCSFNTIDLTETDDSEYLIKELLEEHSLNS